MSTTAIGAMEQQHIHGNTIAVRDLFTGALAESSRNTMYLCNQVPAWIRGKITDILQIADTHVNRSVKVMTAKKHEKLRRELQKLAQLENTKAIFKCGVYETMRTLLEVIQECKRDFEHNDRLLSAAFANAWLALRPDFSDETQPRFVKASDQAWYKEKEFKMGTHRLKTSWLDERYNNLDEKSMPKQVVVPCDKDGFTAEADHTYHLPEDERKQLLSVWKELAASGELTEVQLDELQENNAIEMNLENFDGFEGLDNYQELMKTPAQQRRERGIDINLTSQKRDLEGQLRKKRASQLKKIARRPLRQQAMDHMRLLQEKGYSKDQIAAACVTPSVGKNPKSKKKLRDILIRQKKFMLSNKPKDKEDSAKPEDRFAIHLILLNFQDHRNISKSASYSDSILPSFCYFDFFWGGWGAPLIN